MAQVNPSLGHCFIVSRTVLFWTPTGHGYELQIVPAIVTEWDAEAKLAKLFLLAPAGSVRGILKQEVTGVPECDVRSPLAGHWSLRADEDPEHLRPFWQPGPVPNALRAVSVGPDIDAGLSKALLAVADSIAVRPPCPACGSPRGSHLTIPPGDPRIEAYYDCPDGRRDYASVHP